MWWFAVFIDEKKLKFFSPLEGPRWLVGSHGCGGYFIRADSWSTP